MKYIYVLLFLISTNLLISQSALTYTEFKKALLNYYEEDMISDLIQLKPQIESSQFWSWDVGDYTGDGYPDLAFVTKDKSVSGKNLTVTLVVDIDGYLVKVKEFQEKYVELPLEVGIAIKENTCYVTNKIKQFHWNITGWYVENGNFKQRSIYRTEKHTAAVTKESLIDFSKSIAEERIVHSSSGKISQINKIQYFPLFAEFDKYQSGNQNKREFSTIQYVESGAYYWKGEEDCSFTLQLTKKDDFLYAMIDVIDDSLVAGSNYLSVDKVKISFYQHDKSNDGVLKQFFSTLQKSTIQTKPIKSKKIDFEFSLGDFSTTKSFVSLPATTEATVDVIKTKNGYVLYAKIPFSEIISDINTTSEVGFSISVFDADSDFYPEITTVLSTEDYDDKTKISTLVIKPIAEIYQSYNNLFVPQLITNLKKYGY
ncbi:MAG: hypothetical protein JNL36_01265 [Candidatus Kapabacteria bacterium]|nr:hypothetical protein [Candidatus Kapabacteria bacterium]